MHKTIPTVLAATLCAATWSTAAPADTLEVFDPRTDVTETYLSLGEGEFSAGDTIIETTALVDPMSGESVGRAITRLQIVEPFAPPDDENPMGDMEFILDCTVELDGGAIVFYGTGVMHDLADGITFAVMGGTGEHAGSRGTVTVKAGEANGKEGALMTFHME